MKGVRPVLVLAPILVLAACGGGGSATTITPVGTTTSTAAGVITDPEVGQFAFVRAIDESEIRFDPARLLTGEEAVEAARADGVLAEGEDLPNDFYISNPDLDETVATIDPDGTYLLFGFDRYGGIIDRQLSLADLVAVLNGANSGAFYGIIPGDVPMNLTLVGGTVVSARQQYLP